MQKQKTKYVRHKIKAQKRKTGLWQSPDDDALILSVNHHVSVHVIS